MILTPLQDMQLQPWRQVTILLGATGVLEATVVMIFWASIKGWMATSYRMLVVLYGLTAGLTALTCIGSMQKDFSWVYGFFAGRAILMGLGSIVAGFAVVTALLLRAGKIRA